MKDYYVIWTYQANYSDVFSITGKSPEDVVDTITRWYSEEFAKKAKIYVFDQPPILTCDKGNLVKPEEQE